MIPEGFKEKMKRILGDEYPRFIEAVEHGTAVRGLRVNLIKTEVRHLTDIAGLDLSPIPYTDNGFILNSDEPIGQNPLHHCGAVYMQDPGAMASAAALDIGKEWWVLDLCAAPGGKSSQVAERLGEDGFLLSNEYVPKRAKIIVGNFERLGVKGAMVTSLDTAEFTKMYKAVFDLVIVDAPCSGEGMFRKSKEAIEDWSEENVRLCARRQEAILENAAGLVKAGGYLLYSTCTYSTEENEDVICRFINAHPDYKIAPVKEALKEATVCGKGGGSCGVCGIEHTRHFYPHISDGEGQYLALLKRDENIGIKPTILYKDDAKPLSKAEMSVIDEFIKSALRERPRGRIMRVGENIVLLSHACPIPKGSVFMAGTLLGEIKGKAFVPSHQFFSAYGELFVNSVNLTGGDDRVKKYLHGEELDTEAEMSGWCAVMYEGITLGGAKASGGKLKNHYPKGLRSN